MKYKLGMRNIKTSLVVFICIIIYDVFNWGYPFFAVTAGIISMEASIVSSFKVGRNRIMGTSLGALMGLVFTLISPGNPYLSALGTIVIIYICNLFEWKKSIVIASIVFISIMLQIGNGQVVEYSIDRLVDTSVGILISLLVNFLIAPYNFEKSIQEQFKSITKDLRKLIEDSVCSHIERESESNKFVVMNCGDMEETLMSLNASISHLREELTEYSTEILIKQSKRDKIQSAISNLEVIKETYAHLKVIAPIIEGRRLAVNNVALLQEIGLRISNSTGEVELMGLDIIFNYHLGIILENTQLLLKTLSIKE